MKHQRARNSISWEFTMPGFLKKFHILYGENSKVIKTSCSIWIYIYIYIYIYNASVKKQSVIYYIIIYGNMFRLL